MAGSLQGPDETSLEADVALGQAQNCPAVQAFRWRLVASGSNCATNSALAVVARRSEAAARVKLGFFGIGHVELDR